MSPSLSSASRRSSSKSRTADRGKPREVDPFGKAKSHQQIFLGGVFSAQRLLADDPVAARFDLRQPAFGRFCRGERAFCADGRDTAMGARADARIIVPAPIDQIVPRLRARSRMVRDFVSRQSRRLAQLLGERIELAGKFSVRNTQRAGFMECGKRRALLDGELIEREMVRGVIERAAEFLVPLLNRLPLSRIDQVEGDAARNDAWQGRALRAPLRLCACGRAPSGSDRRAPERRATGD